MYSLGIDLGSSSVKVTIFHYESGEVAGSAHFPPQEMAMIAEKPGWAEQDPAWWWEAFKKPIAKLVRVYLPKPEKSNTLE
jgi:xylulokinase